MGGGMFISKYVNAWKVGKGRNMCRCRSQLGLRPMCGYSKIIGFDEPKESLFYSTRSTIHTKALKAAETETAIIDLKCIKPSFEKTMFPHSNM